MVNLKSQPMITVKRADGSTVKMTLAEVKKMKTVAEPSMSLPEKRGDQVEEVVRRLSFKVPLQNSNRLRTAIQLFLKDVRSELQTREVLTRNEIDGGVGLKAEQADELIRKCRGGGAAKNLGRNVQTKMAGLPEIRPESLPANTTPNNAFMHKPISAPMPAPKMTEFRISSPTVNRGSMQDVSPATPMELNPCDEIQYFSLADLRRLSSDANEAVARLKQKFLNLKDESIVLYLEAVQVWKRSPLYLQYLGAIKNALAKGEKLNMPLSNRQEIQYNEVKAITELNASL